MDRFRSVARVVVVLALAASTQGLLLAQGAWLTNREWIAETLCVNPGTDCDGMCQLADRMEGMGHGEHSHDDPGVMLELSLSVRACVAERPAVPRPSATVAGGPPAPFVAGAGRLDVQGVFRPPRPPAAA